MIVCVCHRVSERDVEREVHHGCQSFDGLQEELRVGTACGACLDCARDTFDHALACRPAAAEVHALRMIPILPATEQPVPRASPLAA